MFSVNIFTFVRNEKQKLITELTTHRAKLCSCLSIYGEVSASRASETPTLSSWSSSLSSSLTTGLALPRLCLFLPLSWLRASLPSLILTRTDLAGRRKEGEKQVIHRSHRIAPAVKHSEYLSIYRLKIQNVININHRRWDLQQTSQTDRTYFRPTWTLLSISFSVSESADTLGQKAPENSVFI